MIVDSKSWQVGDLLEGRYFRIPRYQRPYSWERAHLEEFLQDVITERDLKEDYFIGSMVTAKSDSESTYSIVDGQQRLTTITIFLCAIRDISHAEGATDLASGTHNLIERKNRDNQKQYVLTTRPPSLTFKITFRNSASQNYLLKSDRKRSQSLPRFDFSKTPHVRCSPRQRPTLP